MPEQLSCAYDEDGNGLDDEMEEQLACCFMPRFSFDSNENALEDDEPFAFFNAWRTGPDTIRLKYAYLWRRDGGFTGSDNFAPTQGCRGHDSHDGDTKGDAVEVRFDLVSDGAIAAFVDWDEPTAPHPFLADGTHPELYLSAGKHHEYGSSGVDYYDFDGPGGCDDFHRGDDQVRQPYLVYHTPRDRHENSGFGIDLVPLSGDADDPFLNICDLGRFGVEEPATRLAPWNFDIFGIPSADSPRLDTQNLDYSGGDFVDGIGRLLAVDATFTPDGDGDGVADAFVPAYTLKPDRAPLGSADFDVSVANAADVCPVGDNTTNGEDTDQLFGACEPDPRFNETYVAGGSVTNPATPLNDIIDPAFTTMYPSHWSAAIPRGGFLDTDGDGIPDGEDFCPTVYAAGYPFFDDNRWGEDQNWGPFAATGAPVSIAGFFQRGRECDPYPVAITQLTSSSPDSACGPARTATAGDGAPRFTVSTIAGTSINGAAVTGEIDGQTFRCACRDKTTGEPTTDCLDDNNSDCFRQNVQVADVFTATGYGFLPVQREVCSEDDQNGFCAHYAVDATSYNRWTWLKELLSQDPAKPAHYGPGDFAIQPAAGLNQTAYLQSRFEYAIMTVSDIAAAPGKNKQPGEPWPDPEFEPTGNAGLGDVQSPQSRRLRAAFAGKLRLESERPFSVPAVNCNDPFHLGFAAVWAQVRCVIGCDPVNLSPWWEDPDPLQIVRNDPTLSGLVLVRAAQGTTSSIVADDAARELLGSSAVLTAPLPVAGGAALPDLMLLGSTGSGASWIRLSASVRRGIVGAPRVASAAVAPSVQYYSTDSGQLPIALAPGSRLVSDVRTGFAALFVPGAGIWGYEPQTRTWHNSGASAAVVSRSEPALALVADALVVAGGATADGTLGDAWAVHVLGGGAQQLATSLPARRSALLAVKPDATGFVYAGGFDAAGVARDDAWELRRQPGGALAPRQLRADTGRAFALTPNTAGLELPPLGDDVRLYRLDASQPTGVIHEQRVESGWGVLGHDNALQPRCAADDEHGGEACAIDPVWWADAGTRMCGAGESADGDDADEASDRRAHDRRHEHRDVDGHAESECTGPIGALAGTQQLPGRGVADAIRVGGGAVWVVGGRRLERWDLTTPGQPRLSASALLPKAGTTIAGRGDAVLVGTKAGVQRGRFGSAGITLGSVVDVCGSPKAAAAIGDDTWAVVSDFGLVTVATPPDAPPSVLARAEISVDDGATHARLVSGCGAFGHDRAGPGEGEHGIDGNAAVVADVPAHVFLVLKKAIAEVDLGELTNPIGRRGLALPHRIDALRLDPLNGRAYGAGAELSPIIDLRGDALVVSGAHALDDWVRRSDATLPEGTRISARITKGQVEIAWVVP